MARPSRITILQGVMVIFAAALVGWAAKVQIVEGAQWAKLAKRQHFVSSGLPAARGNILDASGTMLVESRELVRLAVAPNEVRDLGALGRAMRRSGVQDKWVRLATDPRRRWVEIPSLFVASDVAPVLAMRGVHPTPVVDRVYSNSAGLRALTGRIDNRGQAVDGLELSLDSLLRGDSGHVSLARDTKGRRMDSPEGWGTIPEPGRDVLLTINRGLQEICERALSDAVDSLRATGGDIVVMNPHTGEVLAMASRRVDQRGLSNAAVTEPFEPGSTLKPFIAASLLARRRARADEIIDTFGGTFNLGGRVITDVHKEARLSLADVIRYSSNVGIVRFAERLSSAEKYEALRDIGFGTPTGIALPAEAAGTLREPGKWSGTSAASLMMGYEIAVTPLQLVAAYSAIANGGELIEPHIVKEIRSPDGEILYRAKRRAVRRVMSPEVAASVRQMLLGVVQGGTAMKADLVNFQVGGKSGTARRTVAGGGYAAGNYTASFVGLFPGDKPQYVVLVKLDSPRDGYYGGDIAAPVTQVVLRAALAARDAALNRGDLLDAENREPNRVDSAQRALASATPAAPAFEPPRGGRDTIAASDSPQQPAAFVDTPRSAGPITVALPVRGTSGEAPKLLTPVPDVTGLTLREAVRRMHDAGFRVSLVAGSGPGILPLPGTPLPQGSTVQISGLR